MIKVGFDKFDRSQLIAKIVQADGRARRLDSFQHLLPDMDDVENIWFTDIDKPCDVKPEDDPHMKFNTSSMIPRDAFYEHSSRDERRMLQFKYDRLAKAAYMKNFKRQKVSAQEFFNHVLKDINLMGDTAHHPPPGVTARDSPSLTAHPSPGVTAHASPSPVLSNARAETSLKFDLVSRLLKHFVV